MEMFEEKQLMAVQSMLRQDILEEKRRIARLCWKLRQNKVENSEHVEIPEERPGSDIRKVKEEDSEESKVDNSEHVEIPEERPGSDIRKVKEEDSEEVWRERCVLEEAARAALIAEIVRLRNDCALLRAKIEQAGQTQLFVS
ncbi:unnamed protein product, partial [Strongylus vulgaris]